jgi:hypothetical protein
MQSGGFFAPVPDWDDGYRNANAGISFSDADAHLWKFVKIGLVLLRK